MNKPILLAIALGSCALAAHAGDTKQPSDFKPTAVTSTGSVTVGGTHIDYTAVAGTLVVRPDGSDASAQPQDGKSQTPQASMFYAAYFKRGVPAAGRPITFLFNGGPGWSSEWLHMGAFGPVRVLTADHSHTPAAPYRTVNNDESLLDSSATRTISSRRPNPPPQGCSCVFSPVPLAVVCQCVPSCDRWNCTVTLVGEANL
jgi:hypothetical protein